MTVFLSAGDVAHIATHDVIMDAARDAVSAEREGVAVAPPRLDVDLPTGFLRVMPAAADDVMGLKVMTQALGVGNRYLILLYRQETGELLALLDADEVTRLRTAATTAVAGELLAPAGVSRMGLLGTGFEAEGHLRVMARVWPLEEVSVFSRSREGRERFADRLGDELAVAVRPVDSAAEACSAAEVTLLATKSQTPVVDGNDFRDGGVVLSIGSTRPNLRELDRRTFERCATLVVDDAVQVRAESGDVRDAFASGALTSKRMVPMSATARGALETGGADGRDLLVFKSVGTAVQDLTLARRLLDGAAAAGLGGELGELTRLKPFAPAVQKPVADGAA